VDLHLLDFFELFFFGEGDGPFVFLRAVEFFPAFVFLHKPIEFDEFAFFFSVGFGDFGDVGSFVGELEHVFGDLWEVFGDGDIFGSGAEYFCDG